MIAWVTFGCNRSLRTGLPIQKPDELLHGQVGIGDDTPKSALPDLLVVGNNHTRVRLVRAENHVATLLATKNKASAFQSGTDFPTRQLGS